MRKFSERMGYVKASEIIQKDSMTDELRNSLWNVLHYNLWDNSKFMYGELGRDPEFKPFLNILQSHHFKKPIDELPYQTRDQLTYIKNHFFKCEWFEVYDFLQFLCLLPKKEKIADSINLILKRELSAYRFIGGTLAPITDELEIEAVKELLADDQFKGVSEHLRTALKILKDINEPNKRNSIKESISAVESICKEIVGKENVTLGDALKVLEKKEKINPQLKKGFEQLYAYTNNKDDGIRHAKSNVSADQDKSNVGADEAKYFLLSCTSFINYLKTKM